MRGRLLVLALVALAGCTPPRRALPPAPPPILPSPPVPPHGSLWHPEVPANYPFLDVRAHFPGDLLTVLVDEASQGKKDASTTTSAASSISANVQDFFGVPASAVHFLPSGFNPESIVSATTAHDSKGTGETTRSSTLTASITVTVLGVDANGNLHVAGDKVIGVNREEQHIVLSGTVRPEDIASDNSVPSSRLADARIAYYGHGTLADKQNVPWAHRLFDWIWPF